MTAQRLSKSTKTVNLLIGNFCFAHEEVCSNMDFITLQQESSEIAQKFYVQYVFNLLVHFVSIHKTYFEKLSVLRRF